MSSGRSADQRAHPRPSSKVAGTAWPVSVLFVLSPLIGEIVGAALRFSYLTQPLRVAAILCFYGAGAVLVREAVQRRGHNGWGLLLLALAFAVLEEGLGLQTIFNPQGMDGETVYGRAFEVNWMWAVVVTGYHAVWSIVIPIVLTHLLFPAKRHIVWLSRPMPGVFGGVFAVGAGVGVADAVCGRFHREPDPVCGVDASRTGIRRRCRRDRAPVSGATGLESAASAISSFSPPWPSATCGFADESTRTEQRRRPVGARDRGQPREGRTSWAPVRGWSKTSTGCW